MPRIKANPKKREIVDSSKEVEIKEESEAITIPRKIATPRKKREVADLAKLVKLGEEVSGHLGFNVDITLCNLTISGVKAVVKEFHESEARPYGEEDYLALFLPQSYLMMEWFLKVLRKNNCHVFMPSKQALGIAFRKRVAKGFVCVFRPGTPFNSPHELSVTAPEAKSKSKSKTLDIPPLDLDSSAPTTPLPDFVQ